LQKACHVPQKTQKTSKSLYCIMAANSVACTKETKKFSVAHIRLQKTQPISETRNRPRETSTENRGHPKTYRFSLRILCYIFRFLEPREKGDRKESEEKKTKSADCSILSRYDSKVYERRMYGTNYVEEKCVARDWTCFDSSLLSFSDDCHFPLFPLSTNTLS
jgi:hypothetical protein